MLGNGFHIASGRRRRGQNGGVMDDPFEACWYRWERANSRRRDMVKVWNDYVEQQPHEIELVHQGQGIHVIRVIEKEPFPAEFAGLFGEWLYNLRASLDYIIWAAAVYELRSTSFGLVSGG
jgi:hypothetical protein